MSARTLEPDRLPEPFLRSMEALLGDEFGAFYSALLCAPVHGLRINPLKGDVDAIRALLPFELKPVPWCGTGFYYDHGRYRPGLYPLHFTGAYYIQEPSAMAPAAALRAEPGMRVLDLCAAPGGKSTLIAGALEGRGVLVANEIDASRASVLVENLERAGARNAIVLSDTPQRIAERLEGVFDRVLVDAPCSGEGMFRRDPDVVGQWSAASPAGCAFRQREILDCAARALKAGGVLVYSTCTFEAIENEQVIARFLEEHPEFAATPVPGREHFAPALAQAPLACRLWPHLLAGEGQFIAALEKRGEAPAARPKGGVRARAQREPQASAVFEAFAREAQLSYRPCNPHVGGARLYDLPADMPDTQGLKRLRAGLLLGQPGASHFTPSHALALALSPGEGRCVDLDPQDPRTSAYLAGDSIACDAHLRGWVRVCVHGLALGWGKASGGRVKNHYPHPLRRTPGDWKRPRTDP